MEEARLQLTSLVQKKMHFRNYGNMKKKTDSMDVNTERKICVTCVTFVTCAAV